MKVSLWKTTPAMTGLSLAAGASAGAAATVVGAAAGASVVAGAAAGAAQAEITKTMISASATTGR